MNELHTLKIIKEDILRIISEKGGKGTLDGIKEEIKTSNFFVSEAVKELERDKLIRPQQNFFELTGKGEKKARDILRKHSTIETYFGKTKDKQKAHEIAHILEHNISEEVIENIRKLSALKERGTSLLGFKPSKDLLITDIDIPDDKLFERMISMGIFPGEKIKIVNEAPNSIIVEIRNKKFAIDKSIAKEIKVIKL